MLKETEVLCTPTLKSLTPCTDYCYPLDCFCWILVFFVISHSHRFLPRDALCKRGLCYRPVSVCLSVTFVYCIQTAEDTVKLLSPPGSPITLVILTPSAGTQFQGRPLQRGRKTQGVGTFCDFGLKSPFISETVRDRPMVAMER